MKLTEWDPPIRKQLLGWNPPISKSKREKVKKKEERERDRSRQSAVRRSSFVAERERDRRRHRVLFAFTKYGANRRLLLSLKNKNPISSFWVSPLKCFKGIRSFYLLWLSYSLRSAHFLSCFILLIFLLVFIQIPVYS